MSILMFKLAFQETKQRFFSRVFILFSTSCIFIILGVLFSFFDFFDSSIRELETSRNYSVYLDNTVSDDREKTMLSAIQKVSGVKDAKLVSKEHFLESFAQYFPQISHEVQNLDSDTLPRYIKVKALLTGNPQVQNDLRKIQGVEFVQNNDSKYTATIKAFKTMQKLSLLLVLGMLIGLVCIQVHSLKTSSVFQVQLRNALRSVGARKSYLLYPAILKGAVEGTLVGILALGFLLFCNQILKMHFEEFFRLAGASAMIGSSAFILSTIMVLSVATSLLFNVLNFAGRSDA